MANKTIGIYRIVSPSNKIYIGQSWNLEKRKQKYKTLKCEQQRIIYNSLVKYGFDRHKFDIICEIKQEVATQEELNKLEKYYINFYRNNGYQLLNIREGGSNGKAGEESRIRMSKARLGKKPWNKGLTGMVSGNKGKKHSEEARAKMSKAKKGKSTWNKGKKLSASHKIKLREAKKYISNETRLKMSEAKKGNKNRVGGKKFHEQTKETSQFNSIN